VSSKCRPSARRAHQEILAHNKVGIVPRAGMSPVKASEQAQRGNRRGAAPDRE
jgi:hypothetical protein